MRTFKKLLTVSVFVMFLGLFSLTALAVNYPYNISSGDINISNGTGGNAGKIAVQQGTSTIYITPDDTITITGSTAENTINVAAGVPSVKIILSGVSIDVSAISTDNHKYSKSAFDIGAGSTVDLTLEADTINSFKSGIGKAGIRVEKPEGGEPASIIINGTGTLNAVGGGSLSDGVNRLYVGSGAGIGTNGLSNANTVPSGGNITINSGIINATGGAGTSFLGAGIGGGGGVSYGNTPNAGELKIHGGTVTATGGGGEEAYSGPGIGGGSGGYSGTMGTVYIDGGTVTARSGNGKYIANGIGYGFANSINLVRTDPASITITGNAVVNASSSNGAYVYGAIGHNDNGSITIGGTATVTATMGIRRSSGYTSDCGTIACNNLVITDSPTIIVYSPNKQGEKYYLDNYGREKDSVRPIYVRSSITSSVPIMAGIFPSSPKIKTIVLTGGATAGSITITLPEGYASFATTLNSAGTYTGAMGTDVLQNTATLSKTFDITNNVCTFNVKRLDETPPAEPGVPSAAAGPDINAEEENAGVEVAVPLGTSGALVDDVVELLLEGEPFSTPVRHVLTTAEITSGTCTVTIPAARLGADGEKSITARVIDEAGAGPAGGCLTLYLDTAAPAAPTDVQVFPVGGTIVSNALNQTNTNLTASASIVGAEAAGGCANLYINGILKATVSTISAEDTQVTFDLGQSTAAGLQAAVEAGGTVTVELLDYAGNKAVSLIDNPTLTVDYITPVISAVQVPADGWYKAGASLDFTIVFSENVLVSGVPAIQIDLGGHTVNAVYFGGSGTAQLVFRYTVCQGDSDADGIEIVSDTVSLNGGLIRDPAGNVADLTLLNVEDTDNIYVDTEAPVVMSVSVPAPATYGSINALDFTVHFNETVFVTGTPTIPVTLDVGGTVSAGYISGSGTSALTFRYTILSGNLDADGIELGSALVLNSPTTIQDIAGNNAVPGLNSVGITSGVKIDAIPPAILSAAISSDNRYVDITFSKGIYGEGTAALTASKLAFTFTRSGGDATSAPISSIKNCDNENEALASPLTGGETTVRVFLNITGTSSGLETVEIRPATASSIYDELGNPMVPGETTGAIALNDQTAPAVNGAITSGQITAFSVHLSWPAATDQKTTESNLKYMIVKSLSDNISTVADALDNGTVAVNWTANITGATVERLTASTKYYFNVLAKDEAENIAAYTAVTATTVSIFDGETGMILINGERQAAGRADNRTNTQGQSVTTIILDKDKLEPGLRAAGYNSVVTISVTTGTDVAEGALTGGILASMAERGSTLVIQTPGASYSLPASEIGINAIAEQFGEGVALSDIKLTVSIAQPSQDTITVVRNAAEEGGFALVAPALDFTVSCSYNGNTVNVTNFSSFVERLVAIPEGVDPSEITTAIVVEPDGTVRHVPTVIVQKDGKYYAKISSMTNSTYAVINKPAHFSDVESHWAKGAILDMGSRMIVNGVGDGLYEPDRNITRGEFAAIIVKALGLAPRSADSIFKDVLPTDWFNGYVNTAVQYNLITGYTATSFGPDDTITREQAMTIIARAMKLTGLAVTLSDSEASALLSEYTDGAGVSGFAKESAADCLKTGIITGTSANTLSPKEQVTRAEVAVMVQRLLQKSGLI